MTILLQNVRASFPRIVEPEINKSFPNSPAKFSMNLILPKDHPGVAEFMAEVQQTGSGQVEGTRPSDPWHGKRQQEVALLRCR